MTARPLIVVNPPKKPTPQNPCLVEEAKNLLEVTKPKAAAPKRLTMLVTIIWLWGKVPTRISIEYLREVPKAPPVKTSGSNCFETMGMG
jgi:hypothetical protein